MDQTSTSITPTNKSLDRALHLLDIMANKGSSFNIAEIAKLLSINRATAQSIINSLEQENYVEKDSKTGKYSLGYQMYNLGNMYRHKYPFLLAAEKQIMNYSKTRTIKINVIVLKPDAIALIILCKDISIIPTLVQGQVLPAYASACGKLLLSYLKPDELEKILNEVELKAFTYKTITDKKNLKEQLKQFREKGYAYETDELMLNRSCIAAPILNISGEVIAAVSFSATTAEIEQERKILTTEIISLARSISIELGYNYLDF